jgi:hypothetical protein
VLAAQAAMKQTMEGFEKQWSSGGQWVTWDQFFQG